MTFQLRHLGLAVLLCAATLDPAPAAGETPGQAAPSPLRERLASGATAGGERLLDLENLNLFYAERGHRLAWSDGGRLSPEVDALTSALRSADREGLRPADYHTAAIEGLRARLRPANPDAGAAEDLDLLLSDAFFLYASHVTSGRVDPEAVEPTWNIVGRGRSLAFLLKAALDGDHLAETLRLLPPVRQDYRLLRDALAAQRAIAAAGGWPSVPGEKTLREGDSGPGVAALRRRLAATGDLAPGSDAEAELFDATLADALRRFQVRHGLEADAVAGSRTLAELNVPAARRARQIEANLERLRWLPRSFGPRHLLVNVADFRLELTEGGSPTLTSPVIVGRQVRRTPFFTDEIKGILLNPSWTVPGTIALEDKLPQILDDRDFLRDHEFRVFAPEGAGWREIAPEDVDWTRVPEGRFPYRLRQAPGPKNALGRIKFQMPNGHDIYLHDTPSRGLFTHARRLFSSGCIRVGRAFELAERLLAFDPGWPREQIAATIEEGKTVSLALAEPLPVFLLYETAWVDREGRLQFREDFYGVDTATLEALSKPLAAR